VLKLKPPAQFEYFLTFFPYTRFYANKLTEPGIWQAAKLSFTSGEDVVKGKQLYQDPWMQVENFEKPERHNFKPSFYIIL